MSVQDLAIELYLKKGISYGDPPDRMTFCIMLAKDIKRRSSRWHRFKVWIGLPVKPAI